jgi:hypothetical protein
MREIQTFTLGIHWKAKNNHFRFSLFSLLDFFWKSGKVIFSLFSLSLSLLKSEKITFPEEILK